MYSPEINRLRGGESSKLGYCFGHLNFLSQGPLLRDIMENIQELILKSSKGRKAKIYSGVTMFKYNASLYFSMIIIA